MTLLVTYVWPSIWMIHNKVLENFWHWLFHCSVFINKYYL